MRNYPSFPRAIPHLRADCPRVPHPSATLIPEETPFDLHALGTPPALILSQDQTLHQDLFASPVSTSNPKATSQLSRTFVFVSVRLALQSPSPIPLPARLETRFTPSSAHKSTRLYASGITCTLLGITSLLKFLQLGRSAAANSLSRQEPSDDNDL